MPTKKPILQSVIEPEIFDKFMEIATIERRSKSQLTAIAINEYVKNYEKSHGDIIIQNNQNFGDININQ